MFPPNSYVETLTSNVMIFGGRAFGKKLGVDEVMKVGPCGGISGFVRRKRDLSLYLFISVSLPPACTQERPCDDAERRWSSASQEESSH